MKNGANIFTMDKERTTVIETAWFDYAHFVKGPKAGQTELLQTGKNIIVNNGLSLAAGAIGGIGPVVTNWAVGLGDISWDSPGEPPTPDGTEDELYNFLYYKAVEIRYWDSVLEGFSLTPTNVLDIRTTFLSEEANGDLREFGLTGPVPDLILFNYVTHEKLEKTGNFNLERILRLTVGRS